MNCGNCGTSGTSGTAVKFVAGMRVRSTPLAVVNGVFRKPVFGVVERTPRGTLVAVRVVGRKRARVTIPLQDSDDDVVIIDYIYEREAVEEEKGPF